MRAIGVVFVALLLSACGAIPPSGYHFSADGKLVENMPQIENDQFSSSATVVGLSQFDNPFGGVSKQWFLRSFVGKESHVVTHQIYVSISYLGDWITISLAATDQAQSLPVTRIDSQVGSCSAGLCSLSEAVGLGISDAMLRARAQTGFQVKLTGHSGASFVIDITPEMITKQLLIVDRVRTGVPANSNP